MEPRPEDRDGKCTHDILSGLDEVGGSAVPAHSAGAGDQDGLASLLGEEDLAEHTDAVAEDGDERWRDMGGTRSRVGEEDLVSSAGVKCSTTLSATIDRGCSCSEPRVK